MKREFSIGLVVLGVITLVLLIAASILIWNGAILSFRKSPVQLKVFIQAPPLADLGSEIEFNIMIENNGTEFASIDEIRVPASLSDAAVIKGVFPSLFPGQQKLYDETTAYLIGIMLEPGERREFKILMMPWQIADIANNLEVVSGRNVIPAGFRVIFNKPVAAAITSTATTLPTPTVTETPTPQPTLTLSATEIPIPYKAVVKIIAKRKHSSLLKNLWGGSGTIISPDGFILTNAHLVLPQAQVKPDVLIIAMTENPASPPVERYIADTILADEKLDLAIIRITSDLSYRPIDWQTTKLEVMPLGNSDLLQLGDPLTILGYPGIGGQTITLTSGNVGGFTAQKNYGDRAYIKTSATISGGTSGGVALNLMGEMVAIPTQLGSGEEENVVDCRVVTDTNGDGKLNQLDVCVPVGGFINALRPVNLARMMIEEAMRITGTSLQQ